MKEICGVVFNNRGKVYFFLCDGFDIDINTCVVVETDKGEQYAKVVQKNVDNEKIKSLDLKSVIRIADKEDEKNYMDNLKIAKEALEYAKEKSEKLGLDMIFFDAYFTLDQNQLVLNFIADERVDFRELVKALAAKYRTRIELHQVGVRDKSKLIGGIGQCGRELCCSKFLNGIDTIGINMAKNQNIALNPNKINGVCGRLLCCLSYEDDVYSEYRKKCPQVGEFIKTEQGDGTVISVNPLVLKCLVDINGERVEVDVRDK